MKNHNKPSICSIAANEYKDKNIEYDILFIEAFITFKTETLNPDDYILCLEYLAKFSIDHPSVRISYRVRKDKRNSEQHKTPNELKYIKLYDDIIKNSNIVMDVNDSVDSYEAMLKSKIIAFYASSMGMEALAIGKTIFSINIDKKFPAVFSDDDNMIEMHKRDYGEFESKLMYLLNPANKAIVEEFCAELKGKYSCQKSDMHNRVRSIVQNCIMGR
jgi:hypothetical protein